MRKTQNKKSVLPHHTVELVRGVSGFCIYLNGFRIAGEKPGGGGKVIRRWELENDDLKQAIDMKGK